MRRVSARWLLAIVLSAFFASLLSVGHGMFAGEAAESESPAVTAQPPAKPADLCSEETSLSCPAGSSCDKPTPEQLIEIQQIKQAVGINPFEGTLLSGVELEAELPANTRAPRDSAASKKDVASLREAAHQLDKTAHELELQELYSHADEIRQLAVRLRSQARPLQAND